MRELSNILKAFNKTHLAFESVSRKNNVKTRYPSSLQALYIPYNSRKCSIHPIIKFPFTKKAAPYQVLS